LLIGPAAAANLSLSWDPVNDSRVAGYQIHYGTVSSQYDSIVEAASDSATIENLQSGQTYYFAVRACDSAQLFCSAFSSEISGTPPAAPTANFTVSTNTGYAPLTLTFKDTSSGEITGRDWQFGDGGSATDSTLVAYTYNSPGTYSVQLSVSGPGGSDAQVLTDAIVVLAHDSSDDSSDTSTGDDSSVGDDTSTDQPIVTDNSPVTPAVIEVGEIAIDHQWQWIEFQHNFKDPVVVVKPVGGAGSDPATIRVDAVDPYGFEVRIEEWGYDDGAHLIEKASYLVVERGVHQLDNGTWIEAGTIETGNTEAFAAVGFIAPFSAAPVVISSVNSTNESDAVTVRLRNVDTESFEILLQEQEANFDGHATEIIDFVAWEPSTGTVDGRSYEVARTEDTVTHQLSTIAYANAFVNPPAFLADMQSADGPDTANLRWANKDLDTIDIWVDEEQSADSEVNHTTESVGYLLFE
jgi:PKD repeat protein